MDGLVVRQSGASKLILVEHLSDGLKDDLRAQLSAFCYGVNFVAENALYYDFKTTVQQFLERFDTKPPKTQLGMIGELLTHVLVAKDDHSLTSMSLYFNKEEKSIKKGFDLLFLDASGQSVWYAEVKSGRIGKSGTAESKGLKLIGIAGRDLVGKLKVEKRRTLWDSAMHDVGATVASGLGQSVRELLRADATDVLGAQVSLRNVLLVSVLFHDVLDGDQPLASINKSLEAIRAKKHFADLRVVAIRKSTIEAIVDFLRAEAI
jgi:hypothetical protein